MGVGEVWGIFPGYVGKIIEDFVFLLPGVRPVELRFRCLRKKWDAGRVETGGWDGFYLYSYTHRIYVWYIY